MIKILKYVFSSASLLLAGFSFAQTTDFGHVLAAYDAKNNAIIYQELHKIDTTTISEYDKATWLYYYADYQFLTDHHDLAYKAIMNSKKKFSKLNSQSDAMDCNILLLSILSHQTNLKLKTDEIIKELETYGKKNNDTTALKSVYQRIATKYLDLNDAKNSIKYFKKINELDLLTKDTLKTAYNLMNIGTVYATITNKVDSALYFTKKAVPILEKYNDLQNLAYNYNNQAQQYKALSNYKEAIKYYKKSDSIPLEKFEAKSKVIFYENMAEAYKLNKDFENSSKYYELVLKLKDSINDTRQNVAISEIKEKYDNEKLRADNLVTEANRVKNRNIALALGGSLILGSIIAFLVYQNKQRQQQLILQDKEVKAQKLQAQLKEEELKSINAMVEGQEKERQRIANDLHDDLGSLMANIKMHFSSFKSKDSDHLYQRTNDLIEEAYQKIRHIAHAKNSGVLAKNGLYQAIKNHAKSVSAAKEIKIKVIENGLHERLENSVELTIFRIIQELITNTIKHAEAKELDIHLNQYDNVFNIMVEDDGIGFDNTKPRKDQSGMGLNSIERRIEDLGGTVIIETRPESGTSVIIDIPL